MMKKGVWIYFDLGINGDYEGMYGWLDNHNARACGEHLAFVKYESKEDLLEELKADIANKVRLANKNHIYAVSKDERGKVVGKFLAGRRMKAPWIGYASDDEEEATDVA
ncbi:hypothetical protein ACFL2Q_09255 [Thermodesulfobacteriota bacterium]